jgi:signal transduction histidine kinase
MKVLIAEDEAVSRRLLQAFLEKWGHEVTAAPDGAEAWRLFERGAFPVVITDWIMPEVDGLELIRRIRACPRDSYVYVILLTSKSHKEDVVQGMEAGADDFLTKPFDRDELRVRLRAGERILSLEHTLAAQNRSLRQAQAALVQSEKLASLGQLAAGVAHEINNPIAFVGNNLAVLHRDGLAALDLLGRYSSARNSLAQCDAPLAADLDRREQEMDLPYVQECLPRLLEASLRGLQRVRDIVTNLRDFARLDEAAFKEMNLAACLESTLEMLSHELKLRQLNVVKSFAEAPAVLGHPGKINQVLLNVLLNAVQATCAGGQIELRTRPGPDGGAVVEIADTGCGIRPEHLPHIFEPFFTTKPVGQGTGLGLSVSYGIVRDHGGTIEVESTLGKGSLFRISLPARPPAPAKCQDGRVAPNGAS